MSYYGNEFQKIKTKPPTAEGEPPIVAVPNVKTVVISYLKQRLENLKLKNPIKVYSDQPPYVNMHQRATDSGRVPVESRRWVDVILLNSTVVMEGIGQIAKTREILEEIGHDISHFGWLERTELQVTYASLSSVDRDQVGHLIKLYLLEMLRNKYLLKNGIISMKFRSEYDTFDERVSLNAPIYYRVMHVEYTSIFFGLMDDKETYELVIEDIGINTVPEFIPDNFSAYLFEDEIKALSNGKTYTPLPGVLESEIELNFEMDYMSVIGLPKDQYC